jgi:hypothetical protein
MRLIRTAGAVLIAALALGALASASASAALPELGRCVPAETPKTGAYSGAKCLTPREGNGNYNFVPGPGPKPKFEGTSTEGPVLEMPKLTIGCAAATFNGEYTGAKTASVTVVFIGCLDQETFKKCQTLPVKEGEIETPAPLEGEIGFINVNGKTVVGLDLKRSPALTSFTCGEPGEPPETTGTIEGSVIGRLWPLNAMRPEFKLVYKAAAHKQVPESFEGGEKDTLSVKLVSGLTTTTEEAGLKVKLVEILNEEPMEIKAK